MFSLLSPQFLAGFGAVHSCLINFGVSEWGILRPLWGITHNSTSRSLGCVESLAAPIGLRSAKSIITRVKRSTAGMQAALRLARE